MAEGRIEEKRRGKGKEKERNVKKTRGKWSGEGRSAQIER